MKAIQLDPRDQKTVSESGGESVVLQYMPKYIYVEINNGLKKQYSGLPKNWFPIENKSTPWALDKDEHIEILRRGFPIVPDFSSTIHASTGCTLEAAIADLGSFEEKPSSASAMRGYIALSRPTDAEGILINRPFSPLLFKQGPQPYPNLLLKVLQNDVPLETIRKECNAIDNRKKADNKPNSSLLLRNVAWRCCKCQQTLRPEEFVSGIVHIQKWIEAYFEKIIAPGHLRRCKYCRHDDMDMICEICRRSQKHLFTHSR